MKRYWWWRNALASAANLTPSYGYQWPSEVGGRFAVRDPAWCETCDGPCRDESDASDQGHDETVYAVWAMAPAGGKGVEVCTGIDATIVAVRKWLPGAREVRIEPRDAGHEGEN